MPILLAGREFAENFVDRVVRKVPLGSVDRKTRRAFFKLIWAVQARSDLELLRPGLCEEDGEAQPRDPMLGGLLALCEHRGDWLRPIEEWIPEGSAALDVFSSLAHHLLANYPVPPVLLSAWFQEPGRWAWRQQEWFKHAGLGKSLRTAGFPIAMSRRIAHELAHAPAHFPIKYALRWAQVRGLGGSDALAHAVASTWLGHRFPNNGFWTSVIVFLISHPGLDLAQVGPVVDYLEDQKFEPRTVIIGDGVEIELDPPQPDLSIKGWTAASLLRRVARWQRQRDRRPERQLIRWAKSEIGGYQRQDEEGRIWTIFELLDSDELAAEGRAMEHCVASYTNVCSKGGATIWSLGLEEDGERQRVLTIEVEPKTRQVVQAKLKDNDDPDERSRSLVEDWARQQGLTLAW
jgi:hypothetical protein